MMTAPQAVPEAGFHAATLFDPPGRPRPLARRLAIHNRVVQALREHFRAVGFHEIPVTALADDPAAVQLDGMIDLGFGAVWCESEIMPRGGKLEPRHLRGFKLMEAARAGADLEQLCDAQETLIKAVAGSMSADLLGGRHVTRLDRMMHARHRRLGYREALRILAGKGWALEFGEILHPQALATLTRHCGNLPFLLLRLPGEMGLPAALGSATDPDVCESVAYVLPYAGVALEGEVRDGSPQRAGFSLDLGRLLQYLMGLENIVGTLIDPMDRVAKVVADRAMTSPAPSAVPRARREAT